MCNPTLIMDSLANNLTLTCNWSCILSPRLNIVSPIYRAHVTQPQPFHTDAINSPILPCSKDWQLYAIKVNRLVDSNGVPLASSSSKSNVFLNNVFWWAECSCTSCGRRRRTLSSVNEDRFSLPFVCGILVTALFLWHYCIWTLVVGNIFNEEFTVFVNEHVQNG